MSTNSTSSNFYTKINQNYPVAGQNNDSQGFRDNFKNIAKAIEAVDEDVYDIKLNAVRLTSVNDFNDNLIKQASFQDCSSLVFDDTANIQTGDVTIDYRNGHYQMFTINSGTHMFTVGNMPPVGKSAALTVSITTSSGVATYINFNATELINVGTRALPAQVIGNTPQVFRLWNNGDTTKLYVEEVTNPTVFSNGPVVLPSYTTSTLATLTGVQDGSMVFVTSGYNKPAYCLSGTWYVLTGTAI